MKCSSLTALETRIISIHLNKRYCISNSKVAVLYFYGSVKERMDECLGANMKIKCA